MLSGRSAPTTDADPACSVRSQAGTSTGPYDCVIAASRNSAANVMATSGSASAVTRRAAG
jgi:hypothetical protein